MRTTTGAGREFLDIVSRFGIDEIQFYEVDSSFHAHGELWEGEFSDEHRLDFYYPETALGRLVEEVIPEVFFTEELGVDESSAPEPAVGGKWVAFSPNGEDVVLRCVV